LIQLYRERLAQFEGERVAQDRLGVRLGWARVAVFLAAFALYVAADVVDGSVGRGLSAGVAVAVLIFLLLVVWHRRVRGRERRLAALVQVNREAVARVQRDWEALPPELPAAATPDHPYAGDLDVCGETSLFRLLSTVTLPPGVETLRRWLLSPAAPREVRERQEAVAELAPLMDFRQTLEAQGRLTDPPSPAAVERFLGWAEAGPWLPGRLWVKTVARALPLLTGFLVALQIAGWVAGPWWLLSMGASLAAGGALRRSIHPLLDAAGSGRERFARYAALLAALLETEVRAPALLRLKDAVLSRGVGPERELRRLDRTLSWAEVRHSAMAHGILQALLVWDVHVLSGLETWKTRSGAHVRGWLEALGELEALAALAALKADHPDWCFPELLEEGEPGLRALQLGHPLLPPEKCVGNDLQVGPPGSFVFLTGSNMSGKSTLLRSLGLNAVLAQAGGPVCAGRLEMTPLAVHTSMRTADSLARGVSQYMAELQRIRQVVEAARGSPPLGPVAGAPKTRAAPDGGAISPAEVADPGREAPVLYLLDEPLQGTNEAERRVAVQTILGHLLDAGAVGMVATHDLYLDRSERLGRAARAVHFEGVVKEDGAGPLLSFDFQLKPGRATSTNALALLGAVGLGARVEQG
jgi:hypothetical protein